MSKILQKLTGGDLRSIGRSDEVVKDIIHNPSLFSELFEGMFYEDPIVRMRSADVIEKVSKIHPEFLQPFKNRLINEVSKIKQQEVQWHVAQMFSYLELTNSDIKKITKILFSFIDSSNSNIVKVFSLQTLVDIAMTDSSIKSKIMDKLKQMVKNGSPAVVNRCNKLIYKLSNNNVNH
jgi:hypothetical protein